MTQDVQLREYAWWQWVLGGIFVLPFVGMVLTWIVPSTGRVLSLMWIWIGSFGLLVLIGIVTYEDESEQDVSPQVTTSVQPARAISTQAPTIRVIPTPTMTADEGIRHMVLNYDFSHGIDVDDTMSDELLSALFFYEEYLNRPPLEEVRPDDVNDWCFRMVPVMSNYANAPDREKAPILGDNLDAMREESLYCIDIVDNPAARVANHYRWFGEGLDGVAIVLQLALHRMDLMYAAREYRYTLQDITDVCFDRYYGRDNALNKCLAEQLLLKVPIVRDWNYGYDDVRRFME